MSKIIALSLIVEFLAFLIYDFFKSGSRDARHFAIRTMAGATGVTLIALEFLIPDDISISYLLLDMMAVVEILLLYPCSFEKPSLSLFATLIIVGAVALSFVFSLIVPSSILSFRAERIFFSYVVMLVVFNLYFMPSGTTWKIIPASFTLMCSCVLPFTRSARSCCQETPASS